MAYTKEGYYVSGVLDEADAEDFRKALKEVRRKYPGKEGARKLLIKSGIYTPDGKLAKEYSR